MEDWYEFIRYHREIHCEGCGKRLVRRASDSPVFRTNGEPSMMDSFGGYDYDDRADYAIRCGGLDGCGTTMEIHTPEDAKQMKGPIIDNATAIPVTRLT